MGYREDAYWDARIERAIRARHGISWGTLFVGILIGGFLF